MYQMLFSHDWNQQVINSCVSNKTGNMTNDEIQAQKTGNMTIMMKFKHKTKHTLYIYYKSYSPTRKQNKNNYIHIYTCDTNQNTLHLEN